MKIYCTTHPDKVALSICVVCKKHYCKECLLEGEMYYYCHTPACYAKYVKENDIIDVDNVTLENYKMNPRFCPRCLENTLPESTGNLTTINFIGTKLKYVGQRCNVCNSYVAEKCSVLFGLTIQSHGFYRVIEIHSSWLSNETKFYSRKIKMNNFLKSN